MGPILVKKILGGRSHFTKIVKSIIFEAEKPLEMVLDLQKFRKKKTLSKNPLFFEWEKSLDMGRGFGPRAVHSVQNNSSTP